MDESTLIGSIAFYNCQWNIKGVIKGEKKSFIRSEETPSLNITYLLPENADKVEFNWLQIWCVTKK